MDFGAQMVLSSAAFCLTPDIVAPSSRIGAGTPQTDSPIGLGLRAVVASSGDKDGNLVKSYNDRWEEKAETHIGPVVRPRSRPVGSIVGTT